MIVLGASSVNCAPAVPVPHAGRSGGGVSGPPAQADRGASRENARPQGRPCAQESTGSSVTASAKEAHGLTLARAGRTIASVTTIAHVTSGTPTPFSHIDDIEERGSALVIFGWMLLPDGPPD